MKFQHLFEQSDYEGYFGVIYKITNTINSKLYIGQSVSFLDRVRLHEETAFNVNAALYNLPLYKAIRKYSPNNFTIEIIDHGNDIDDLNNKEIYYIDHFKSLIDFGKGYNLEKGGYNGLKSEWTKAKMSKSQKGEKNPSYGHLGSNGFRAIPIIDLDTKIVYGSMLECAEKLYNDRRFLKQLSRVTDIKSNRLSYKGKHFARIKDNNIIIKISVAKLLGYDISNANGKSYITIDVNTLSKKA